MNSRPRLSLIADQPSWTIASEDVEVSITRTGGHMAPVVFDRRNRKITPYSLAPWSHEKSAPKLIPLLDALRGDFFCMPFGANATNFRGEQHPAHGETANRTWTFARFSREQSTTELHLRMRTRIRTGRVDKMIRLIDGHNVVYCQHRIDLESGPMNFGYHAMLKCPDSPRTATISTSRTIYGQVFPEPTERPENRGYSLLKPGSRFDHLESVSTVTGQKVDLTQYPDRRGYEDIVQILNDPKSSFAWSAVSFPGERYVWFTLKDPRVLSGTVIWFSNGGRHYPPWNGRHLGVLGIEEVTSFFVYGLEQSVQRNSFNRLGVKTAISLKAGKPLNVSVISGIALVPRGFNRVCSIEQDGRGIRLTSDSGQHVNVPVDVEFLYRSVQV